MTEQPIPDGDPSLKYDEGYEPPPVHGVHATKPYVNEAGEVCCSVCDQAMMQLAPEMLEHDTDRR